MDWMGVVVSVGSVLWVRVVRLVVSVRLVGVFLIVLVRSVVTMGVVDFVVLVVQECPVVPVSSVRLVTVSSVVWARSVGIMVVAGCVVSVWWVRVARSRVSVSWVGVLRIVMGSSAVLMGAVASVGSVL